MWSKELETLADHVDALAGNGGATPEKLAHLSICLKAASLGVAALEALPVPDVARPTARILPAGVTDLEAFRNGGAL